MEPRLMQEADGSVVLDNLAPAFVFMLLEVPQLLGPDAPDEVKRRLFPDPSDDDGVRADWDRLVRPELYALIASTREIVTRDLRGLAPAAPPDVPDRDVAMWRLPIPAAHVKAWISALNAARLALGAMHGIETEADLHADFDAEDPAPLDERRLAIVRINVLAELQAMLIFCETGGPEDEAEDEAGDTD